MKDGGLRSIFQKTREEEDKFATSANKSIFFHVKTIWDFTSNDLKSIVAPETAFGVFSALSGPLLTTNTAPNLFTILSRIPQVILWNYLNLLVFDVSNQRLPASCLEDSVNKPWRPLPSHRLSLSQARRFLLFLIPLTIAASGVIGALQENVFAIILTWMYNDLHGADEHYVTRNLINAAGFACYSFGSTRVAAGYGTYDLNYVMKYQWSLIVGGIVFSTLQMQDMSDQAGDSLRNRGTLPLVWGDMTARWTIAIPVAAWSVICPAFWQLEFAGWIGPLVIGALLAGRVLLLRNVEQDRITWKICKGDIVRFGPNRISVNTSTALSDIYGFDSNTQKSNFYGVFSAFFKVPGSMTTIDKVQHSFKRHITSQALSAKAVKGMEELIIDNVGTFFESLLSETSTASRMASKRWSAKQNMSDCFGRLTFDIIGDLCFGRNWNVMNNERNRKFLEIIPDGVAGLLLAGHMPAILTFKIDSIFFSRLTNDTRQFEAMSKSQTARRIKTPDDVKHPDIFQRILDARDPETGRGFTAAELNAEAITLIVAGSHSIATTLSSTLFYLLHSPPAFKKLQLELHNTFSEIEDIRIGPELNACRYLRACLDEAMRLTPPIGGILPREVLHGGLSIDGHHFPAGTDVGVPTYALHHSEAYFPDAFAFKPERWIVSQANGVSEESVKLAQCAFCPFSLGPRGCPGKGMAYAEMMIVIARMVLMFDMRLDDVSPAQREEEEGYTEAKVKHYEFETRDKFIAGHDGPMVSFKAKK